jgi:hypothetical protein
VNEATKEAGIMEQTGLIHLSFKSKHKYTHTLGKQLHFMTMSHISMISRVATPYHPWRTIAMPFFANVASSHLSGTSLCSTSFPWQTNDHTPWVLFLETFVAFGYFVE